MLARAKGRLGNAVTNGNPFLVCEVLHHLAEEGAGTRIGIPDDVRQVLSRRVRHLSAWSSPADVKADFGNASVLKDGRVVFNIGGNKYRLVVWINYAYRVVYVRFMGTHDQYDRIDAQRI